MNDFRNNSVPLASARRRPQAPDQTAPLAFDSRARVALAPSSASGAPASRRSVSRPQTDRGQRFARRDDAARPGHTRSDVPARAPRSASGKAGRSTNFVKYSADGRAVQKLHEFTSGSLKPLFIALVVAAVALGLYFPIRDYYVAWRTGEILSKQVDLRKSYNEGLQENVDKYLSQEGIEEAARSELGMVLPGETRIELTGNEQAPASSGDAAAANGTAEGDGSDADGSDGAASDGEQADGEQADAATADPDDEVPSTSAEAEKAEAAAALDAPWYIEVLDTVFFFGGVEGQTVVSTGGN